ncbi:MAG: hypothetical protein OEZ58_23430 [Gammaproteobacteria bacterium]|nr:hypothetical protein [Gammaproteobacteria bacterium]MDH5731947.1 hypothetical protein [Gammaproteobacteria bacterium]
MKIVYSLVLTLSLFGQDAAIAAMNTSDMLKPGEKQIGVFSPLRYSLNQSSEISTHPLFDLIIPNLRFKKRWIQSSTLGFASEHYFSYPSLLLNTIARDGSGGILPANTRVPQILSWHNSVIASTKITDLWLSARLSLHTPIGAKAEQMPTIDLPFVYQRTSAYHYLYSMSAGLELDGRIQTRWRYIVDIHYFYLNNPEHHQAVEQKTSLVYELTPTISIFFAYIFTAGHYPFGIDMRYFPFIDVIWRWQ